MGPCTYCGEIPTKILKYDLGYGKLVEWYCAKCFERWVEKEPGLDISLEL